MSDAALVLMATLAANAATVPLSKTVPVVGCEPCPFCGSSNIHNWSSDDHDPGSPSWSCMCFSCECEGPHCDDERESVERWNRRA